MSYNSIGGNNGAGTARELFEKKMSTDVMKYFQDTNIFKARLTNRNIESGKSESFPIVGQATASSVANDGAELAVQSIKATEREISIGDLTVAHAWITDLDAAMAKYDAKAAQTESIGRALAKKVDTDSLAILIEAAQIEDAASAAAAGLKVFADDRFTSIQTMAGADVLNGAAVYALMQKQVSEYAQKDAPGTPFFALRTAQYFALLNNPANTGLTWVNDEFAKSGKVPMVLGHEVTHSPNFPAFTGAAGAPGAGDVVSILAAKESAGCLELLSVNVKSDYIPTRLAHLIVGKMAVGYGVLNHACAVSGQIA